MAMDAKTKKLIEEISGDTDMAKELVALGALSGDLRTALVTEVTNYVTKAVAQDLPRESVAYMAIMELLGGAAYVALTAGMDPTELPRILKMVTSVVIAREAGLSQEQIRDMAMDGLRQAKEEDRQTAPTSRTLN